MGIKVPQGVDAKTSSTKSVGKKDDLFVVNKVTHTFNDKDNQQRVHDVINTLLAVKSNASAFNKVAARTNEMLYKILADIYQVVLNIESLDDKDKKQLKGAIENSIKDKGYNKSPSATFNNLVLKYTFAEKLDRRRIFDYEQSLKLASKEAWLVSEFVEKITALGGVTEAANELKGVSKAVAEEELTANRKELVAVTTTTSIELPNGSSVPTIQVGDQYVAFLAVKKKANNTYTFISALQDPKAQWLDATAKQYLQNNGADVAAAKRQDAVEGLLTAANESSFSKANAKSKQLEAA